MFFLCAERVRLTYFCGISSAHLTVLIGHRTLHFLGWLYHAGLGYVGHSEHFILVRGSVKNSAPHFAAVVFLFKFQERMFRQLFDTYSITFICLKTLG